MASAQAGDLLAQVEAGADTQPTSSPPVIAEIEYADFFDDDEES